MISNNSDRDWEKLGRVKPYFAVLTQSEFLPGNLDEGNRKMFFASGEEHVARVLETTERLWGQGGRARALDFGSGVGRIVIPLARRWERVIGVDISRPMIAEAEKNCRDAGLGNVEFVRSSDELADLRGPFDFIHSVIVFQHIPPARGRRIMERLVSLLAPGGVGALHFTYHIPGSSFWRAFSVLRQRFQPVNWAVNLLKRRSLTYPMTQMNAYDLPDLFRFLQGVGVGDFHAEFTDHGGYLGVVLYFRKPIG